LGHSWTDPATILSGFGLLVLLVPTSFIIVMLLLRHINVVFLSFVVYSNSLRTIVVCCYPIWSTMFHFDLLLSTLV